MENHWLIITTRFGSNIRDPSDDDLQSSLRDVYVEDDLSLTEADYAEHPNSWLKLGYQGGPLYVLDVYRKGTVRFQQWADTDYRKELAPPLKLEKVPFEKALALWGLLRDENIKGLLSESWQTE